MILSRKKPKIKESFGIANTTSSPNRQIRYIVIHYTATSNSIAGKAQSIANYFSRTSSKASADFIVDEDNIVQYNPDISNRYCWSVGGGRYNTKGGKYYEVATNKNCINVEMCSYTDNGLVSSPNDKSWHFHQKVVKKTIKLVRWLMKAYDIPAYMVIRHYDVNGKPCPGIIGWNLDSGSEAEWEKFKKKLL